MKLFEIGAQIKKIRKEAGITQTELAQKANISRVTLGKCERGQMGAVSIRTMDVILSNLNYEIELKEKIEHSFGIPKLDEIEQ